ncbi:putative Hsp90 binding co-chaperone [Russula earlei]|uniref:Hsp90 binding co-chaperone n=1 Tax=Russula earlei TaxID=71964 RepID=A0ACC0UF41_9AGAM|nr:putative Hsp90 binding co-chaperone [Russula earlei]
MSKHPEVLWAQLSSETAKEKNVLFVTINLPDIVESSLQYELTSTALLFKAQAGLGKASNYELKIDFFKEIIPEESAKRLTSRALVLNLRKKVLEREYWPRLTKDKIKSPYIKTDFSKWIDEDEQEGTGPAIDDDFDMGGFGGAGGLPSGLGGGMDFESMMAGHSSSDVVPEPGSDDSASEDETQPPLESAEGTGND